MLDIPMDILQEVFQQSWSSPLRAHQAGGFPWYLGHVCSRWRALFFSMRSTFWNRIEIEWYDKYGPGPDDEPLQAESAQLIEEIVDFFLDCTHGGPFSFAYCIKEGYTERDSYDVRPILVGLFNHSEQWEEASIRLLSTELVFLCAAKDRLPLLKKLEISVETEVHDRRMHSTTPRVVTNVFDDAPLLTHIVLWDTSTWQFKFNWSSLTIVNFKHLENCKNILSVLRETINLVELNLFFSHTSLLHIDGGELIHLPHLEHLSVDWVALLTALETPALQRLKIRFSRAYDADFNEETGITVAFLRRSGIKKLNTLAIDRGHGATIKDILPSTPEVDKLTLHCVPDTADVLKWLSETGTQKLRFSNLIVSWPHSTCAQEYLDALHDMIARRNPPGDERHPNPKEVVIKFPRRGESVVALKSLCRDRGIPFKFIHEMSTLPWGLNL